MNYRYIFDILYIPSNWYICFMLCLIYKFQTANINMLWCPASQIIHEADNVWDQFRREYFCACCFTSVLTTGKKRKRLGFGYETSFYSFWKTFFNHVDGFNRVFFDVEIVIRKENIVLSASVLFWYNLILRFCHYNVLVPANKNVVSVYACVTVSGLRMFETHRPTRYHALEVKQHTNMSRMSGIVVCLLSCKVWQH